MLKYGDIGNFLANFVYAENDNLCLFPITEKKTVLEAVSINNREVPLYINEFWTARQRQASSLQEVSYRACFKPQLPRFFINLLTREGDLVYDPFSGRGTTIIEAALLGRRVIANDVNPLSKILTAPRLAVPPLSSVMERLSQIPPDSSTDLDLSMFYHPKTEAEIAALRNYLVRLKADNREDDIDHWIRMVATNRLTGHSKGFFSIYTLPPNQAVSMERQKRINKKRNQQPEYRDTKTLIMKKSRSLIKGLSIIERENLQKASSSASFYKEDARQTFTIPDASVQLTVTSPPFLDVVQYSQDNWLRCWFNDLDMLDIEKKITMAKTVEQWSLVMGNVFVELYRITRKGGWVAFEVGEVKQGRVKLEEHVVPLGLQVGFECAGIIINQQEFTKTSNIWGVENNQRGTNTNRIVLFYKS